MTAKTDAVERYVRQLVNGLMDGGVSNAVICPGSRSTPIALAFARNRGIKTWVLYDERSAAFFALGLARSLVEPVALVCTSGTAGANFLPAAIESKLGRVPLVIVTADRPPESRDFGAAQTIDQIRLYGPHVKWFQDMPIAVNSESVLRYSRFVGARASSLAKRIPAGPVHINMSFREPLLADASLMVGPEEDEDFQPVSVAGMTTRADQNDVKRIASEIDDGAKGLIVVGPGAFAGLHVELSRLSRILGWPILADSLSDLRQAGGIFGLVRCYEFLLRSREFRRSNAPEWVIRLGGIPTSKELNSFCEGVKTILLDEGGEWRDPNFSSRAIIHGSLKDSLLQITRNVSKFKVPANWLDTWIREDARACEAADSFIERTDKLFEGKLFHRLSKVLTPSSKLTVLVGNSMPVRDLNYFFLDGSKNIHFEANRGANGIDGIVSTAMGISAVEGNVLLILGDISFCHDMNGLFASKLYGLNVTILVVNNRGGGIFSFLEQRSLPEPLFERLFGEGHDIDFSGVKTIYGGEFHRVVNWSDFERVLPSSIKAKGLKIIEFVAIDRKSNFELHRELFRVVSGSVGG